ncbi:hypothetical protein MKW92_044596 [Papaver armeniacum]|nr:hypothetical protein MKW92_044596 [Papaver armeniacum]
MGSLPHDQQHRTSYTSNLYAPPMGYWMTGGAYGVPGLAQPPLIYGGGPTSCWSGMLSMLLPDGWVGHVLQSLSTPEELEERQ